ncbi:MupG family TIM beta-alpha barrel fold protein [Companilactobacillus huachuanensis]|uniref:MupG family TIM beta-alpha barrel fold protein n=1 Tax=Companilactobacillus huachuanensis TaxID=2559914 RepID=A0ABW1RPU3_9LACO|nr:MupG family TIM beta-alpha barrel fold protein [Companilactobacillus huachuanensis]
MLGFSAYLHSSLKKDDLVMFNKFVQAGFKGVFTSINLPEDDPKVLLANLKSLGQMCADNKLELTLDVSSSALKRLNLELPHDLNVFQELHVTMLRIDDGISIQEIAQLSQEMKIALNASTIVQSEIDELKADKADFTNLEAWHNYYPRENTGLDRDWFKEKNRWLKLNNFKVMAFIAGDENLRAPVYKGLPTLEENRYENPLVAALNMGDFDVDRIYIGDSAIATTTFEQFRNYFVDHVLQIRVQLHNAPSYISHIFHQRADVSRDVVRLKEGRPLNHSRIEPNNSGLRRQGSITLDNVLSGRYQGELQLVKYQLPADNTVNVIGQIADKDIGLMKYCVANQAIQLIDIES